MEYVALLKRAYNVMQRKTNPDAEVSGRILQEDTNPIEAARRSMKAAQKKKVEESAALKIGEEQLLRVAETLQIDVSMLRTAFQRAVSSAHASLDKVWIAYEQFEKSLGNPPLAAKLLGDYMPKYLRGKAAYKELQHLFLGVDHLAMSVPIRPNDPRGKTQHRLLEKWKAVVRFERTNPLRLSRPELQVRVTLFFQQASLALAFHAELWHDFANWLDLGGQPEKATACLRQAVERFLPQDLTLRLFIAQRCEVVEAPLTTESHRIVDDEYQKLMDDMPKPCPLALINYLCFVRRQKSAAEFREAFLEATESSSHCTWELYAFVADVEYHVYGSAEAASRIFRLGMERYGEREPSLLAAYINFLTSVNDLKSARAELSRGVLDRLQVGVRDQLANRSDKVVRDSLGFLWQKWTRMERYFGDAGAVRKAVLFSNEEYRNLQRDQEVEEEAIQETPLSLGLSTSITELEESFRFQHLIPRSARADPELKAAPPAASPATAVAKSPGEAKDSAATSDAAGESATAVPDAGAAGPELVDHSATDAADEQQRLLGSARPAGDGLSAHISRPDPTKMLGFRPALDVVGRKRAVAEIEPAGNGKGGATFAPGGGARAGEEQVQLPTMIPKCLQDLLAVLPTRPLKGAKPDVDYLLTVLQQVNIPAIPVKDLEDFRYDSLRLSKEDDSGLLRRLLVKDELDGASGFFSSKPTAYRERLQAKRRKIDAEQRSGVKVEGASG
jgi:tetratricopeptide (TPR) repeat protein